MHCRRIKLSCRKTNFIKNHITHLDKTIIKDRSCIGLTLTSHFCHDLFDLEYRYDPGTVQYVTTDVLYVKTKNTASL